MQRRLATFEVLSSMALAGILVCGNGCASRVSAQPDADDNKASTRVVQPARSATPRTLLPAPAVSRAFETWSLREATEDAVSRIGVAAVPELQRWLSDSNPAIRREGADLLGRIGPGSAPAIPNLAILLDDEDPEVRKYAVRALGQIGPSASNTIPQLMRLLREELVKEQMRERDENGR